MALEAARLLDHMGCDVRVYDPQGLPVKDDCSESHPKVQELRILSDWSQAQFWCSPEQHGNITAVMKNQSGWTDDHSGTLLAIVLMTSRLDSVIDRLCPSNSRQSFGICTGELNFVVTLTSGEWR
jgi:NAD(P)H-dependent FMN reductase